MGHMKHGVFGKSDPNFKPDPNVKMVFDEKKGVYRKVAKKAAKSKQRKG